MLHRLHRVHKIAGQIHQARHQGSCGNRTITIVCIIALQQLEVSRSAGHMGNFAASGVDTEVGGIRERILIGIGCSKLHVGRKLLHLK